MKLRHLRYLVAVAEAGTFTRAGERLFIAQPTLSQQIGRLDQIVGTPLLHRPRDGVQLTTELLTSRKDLADGWDVQVLADPAQWLARPVQRQGADVYPGRA